MSYATQQDLIDRYGLDELQTLTDRVNGAVVDAAVLARALADADAEIDSHLGTRYQLPLASVPPVLVRIASDITRYRLFDSRVTESVRNRYQDAIRDLKAIGSGANVFDGATVVAVSTQAVAVISRSPAPVFNEANLAGY